LTTFGNTSGLAQAQSSTYAQTLASGTPSTPSVPGSAAGSLVVSAYEKSNVNYFEETIKVAELQRSISANLSMVKLASDMITSFIQKLG
jgi:flagellar hook protein FlgE